MPNKDKGLPRDFNPNELNTKAHLTFQDGVITSIELILNGNVPSINQDKFTELAEEAKTK